MADLVLYWDTGSDAGGDGTTSETSSGDNTHAYQSLNQAEAGGQQDLTAGGGNTLTLHGNRTNGGGVDQVAVVVNGYITSATYFLAITQDDFPADGIYDNAKALLENNDDALAAIRIQDNHVRVLSLQILVTTTGGTNTGIYVDSIAAANAIFIGGCIVKGVCSGTGSAYGVGFIDADIIGVVYNCTFSGFDCDADFYGIRVNNCTTADLYNNTIYNCYRGIRQENGTVTAINCPVFNCTDDILGTVTLNNCGTEDGDDSGNNGNFTITQSADDWAALVVDAAGGDFDYTDESSELFETGNGATPKGTFTDDIIGTERPGVDLDWCVGAYDNAGAPPAGNAGIMTTNTGFWGATF
jgi:hypothetical protein